jgi:hypothetical protein
MSARFAPRGSWRYRAGSTLVCVVIGVLRWFYAEESGPTFVSGHVNRCKIVSRVPSKAS